MKNNIKNKNTVPNERQILGAKIRAEAECFYIKKRRPYQGGYLVPPKEDLYNHLAKIFKRTPLDISYYMTYSRSCTHPWSDGACPDCPDYP